jgi:outer membrane lipoprotein-sorting protein
MNALPPSLDRFGAELESAVGRDLRTRRTRRRTVRGAVVLAVAAAVALGLLNSLTGSGPSVVQRAAAALQSSGDSILHYSFDATQQNGDGTTATWKQETWQLRVAPYTRRQIAVDGTDGIRAESVSSGDTNELYDASNDTIYIATNQQLVAARMPNITIVSKSKLAKLTGSSKVSVAYVLRKSAKNDQHPKVLATRQGAKRLRAQLAREPGDSSGGVLPEEFRSEILVLLRSGRVVVTGHVTVDGRDAIRLESLDGKKIYIVDASTYAPIEWTTTGNSGGVTLRFGAYEELPVDTKSMQLLSLQDQYPNARVVRGAAAYIPAESRLYPHG